MGERREYPAFIVNNGPTPVNFDFFFQPGIKTKDDHY
jgi:hypothetical protein